MRVCNKQAMQTDNEVYLNNHCRLEYIFTIYILQGHLQQLQIACIATVEVDIVCRLNTRIEHHQSPILEQLNFYAEILAEHTGINA